MVGEFGDCMSEVEKPKTYEIPATIERATQDANMLGVLALSASWKRAAIVRAFVAKDSGHGQSGNGSNVNRLSMKGFARLGIIGLSSFNSVRRYYDAWDDSGLPDPTPGEFTELPDVDVEFPSLSKPDRKELEPGGKDNPDPPRRIPPDPGPGKPGKKVHKWEPDPDWGPDELTPPSVTPEEARAKVVGSLARANASMIEALQYRERLASEMDVRDDLNRFFTFVEQMVNTYGRYLSNGS